MSFVAKYDLVYVSGKKQSQILQQMYNCEGGVLSSLNLVWPVFHPGCFSLKKNDALLAVD